MKKLFLGISLFCLLLVLFAPMLAGAKTEGLVPCDGVNIECQWGQVEDMLYRILAFIINTIAIPLATLAIIVGGIILLTSAGSPNQAGLGKKIIFAAIIGLILALGTKGIVTFILKAIGCTGAYCSL